LLQKQSIFTLIKSLSTGEKRTFKLYASKYAKKDANACVQLFDILNSLNSYDSNTVKKIFEPVKHLSVTKTKLFKLILESLSGHSSTNKQPIFIINNQVEFAHILQHRSLFKEAANFITKAREYAQKLEYHNQVLAIISQEKQIINRILPVQEYAIRSNELDKIRIDTLNKLNNKWEYSQLTDKLWLLYRTYDNPQSSIEKKVYQDFFNHPLLSDPSKALSTIALLEYYSLQTLCLKMLGNIDLAYEKAKQQLAIIEKKIHLTIYELGWIFSTLNNLITLAIELNKYNDFKQYLAKLNDIPNHTPHLTHYHEKRIFEININSQLQYCISTQKYNEGIALVPTMEEGIKTYQHTGLSKDRIIRLYFSIGLLYYYLEEWNISHIWIKKTLEEQSDQTAITIIALVRIMDLFLHLQHQNYVVLKYQILKTRRFLNRNKRLLETEAIILKYLSKISKFRNIQHKNNLQKLYQDLLIQKQKTPNNSLFTYLKLDIWLETKINDTSFLEACQINNA